MEENITKGAEIIPHFKNSRAKGKVLGGIINKRNLTGRVMIDPLMAKIVVMKLPTQFY